MAVTDGVGRGLEMTAGVVLLYLKKKTVKGVSYSARAALGEY
jgi:hypothetical protein